MPIPESSLQFDREHIWHPYSSLTSPISPLPVKCASGVTLTLEDDRTLIDGMASWWSVIHGYNNPVLNDAIAKQCGSMAHVMFGGLTHQPAIDLCRKLVEITPPSLEKVFLSDSGSVAVEVALKMALQYWHALDKPDKNRFLALRGGYHGDTLGAMSVCDPDTGMHHLFGPYLPKQYFVDRPACLFGQPCESQDTLQLAQMLQKQHAEIAAVIVEPVVQGAGGMYFYSTDYLAQLRALCDEYNVLLILDEIATGFGRTGKMFASEHSNIAGDILCVGKAMTGGYLSLAATLCTKEVADTVCNGEAEAFMHGPTYMGNPLACAVSNASIQLLEDSNWKEKINAIELSLQRHLNPLSDHPKLLDCRVLGAIGVIEAENVVDMRKVQKLLPELGVWLRPFGKLIYTMPPYICEESHLKAICAAMQVILEECT